MTSQQDEGLLKRRIIRVGQIDEASSGLVIAKLLFLSQQSRTQDIVLRINSPGGSVTAGLAIYDTMQELPNSIGTLCFVQASGMAAVLLASGAKGKRLATPNSTILLTRPWGGSLSDPHESQAQEAEISRLSVRLAEILAKHTHKTSEQTWLDSDQELRITADESVAYGLVDRVLSKLEMIRLKWQG